MGKFISFILTPTGGSMIASIIGFIIAIYTLSMHVWGDLVKITLIAVPSLITIIHSETWQKINNSYQSEQKGHNVCIFLLHLTISLSLVFVTYDLVWFYICFATTSVISSLYTWFIQKDNDTKFNEIFNALINIVFALLGIYLYQIAETFENDYSIWASDRIAYQIRLTYLRGELLNPMFVMGIIVFATFANAIQLFIKRNKITR